MTPPLGQAALAPSTLTLTPILALIAVPSTPDALLVPTTRLFRWETAPPALPQQLTPITRVVLGLNIARTVFRGVLTAPLALGSDTLLPTP